MRKDPTDPNIVIIDNVVIERLNENAFLVQVSLGNAVSRYSRPDLKSALELIERCFLEGADLRKVELK